VTTWPAMLTSTPDGTETGFCPILDIARS